MFNSSSMNDNVKTPLRNQAPSELTDMPKWPFCYYNSNYNNNTASNLAEKNKQAFINGTNIGPVINLSSYQLTPSMIDLLSKGLNFCPTPGAPERFQLRQDLDKFHVSLRRKLFFEKRSDSTLLDQSSPTLPDDDSSSEEGEPFDHFKFKNPSKWNPPGPFHLETFIALNENKLNEYQFPDPSPSNLVSRERLALAELSKATNIIIKPADKGSAVVIQDLDDYVNEGIRQLSDPNFYIETKQDLTDFHNEIVTSLVNYLEEQGEISKKCGIYLRNTKPRTSQLYLLPKVHKGKLPMPGRPIVSANNSPTERISEFADFFLKPLVQNTKSFVRDTTDFINKIEAIQAVPPNCLLCTVDVTSLYTNIPNDEGILACKNILDKYRTGDTIPSNENIALVLEHVLNMNNFDFNSKHYLQVGGTAMGTRVAPSFANIFMADFEEKYVYTYHTQPKIWLRYIDDIFMIWDHDKAELEAFLNHLNQCHHSIKFTSEISEETISFLDTSVHIDSERKLYTDLYCKPTDSHNYLLYSSSHPKHLLRSLPYSQFLRIRRICNHIDDYDKNAAIIGNHFTRRGYPDTLIMEAMIKARRMDRASLLKPKPATQSGQSFNDLFVVTNFNPDCSALKDIVQENWSLLGRTNTTDTVYNKNPVYGYRRNKNLKDILVHAKIVPEPTSTHTITQRKVDRLCKSKTCRYCPRLDKTGKVCNSHQSIEFNTKTNITCNSNNLIYCIKCNTCNMLYVGQTKNAIKDRFKAHFYSINKPKNSDTTVGCHYSRTDHHGIQDTTIMVLEFITSPPNTASAQRLRDEMEKLWIHRLSTIAPLGLNSAD
jgi:peptide-methionine (R)-S-oxide reductase